MGVVYIFIIPDESFTVKLFFKLIPMWLIIAYAFLRLPQTNQLTKFHKFMLTGLIFCMLGDGFIAVSFIAGLGAFLIGHLFYMAGFFMKKTGSPLKLATVIPLGIYSFFIGRELVDSLIKGGDQALMIPVIFYILVISIMLFSAILTGNKWAILGSFLFVISDSILSWNLFVTDISYSGVWIMTTYYSAQFFIAHSIKQL